MVRGELSSLVNLMIPMEWARPEIWVFWGKSTAFMRLGSGAHVTALENSLRLLHIKRSYQREYAERHVPWRDERHPSW
jgi:hypothetical protein